MKRSLQIFVVVCLLVLGISVVTFAQGQGATDIIKNLKILSIKSVEASPCPGQVGVSPCSGQEKYLRVLVELQNDNDMDIKLAENVEFKFYIQEREPNILKRSVYIGEDVEHKGAKNPILIEKKTTKDVPFVVDMETATEQPVQQTMIHMLNFIGKPTKEIKTKDLFIRARFDLGFKSDRGWSYGEKLRVEWMFCPQQQDHLPLEECYVEPIE